jgi:hypothetical protein
MAEARPRRGSCRAEIDESRAARAQSLSNIKTAWIGHDKGEIYKLEMFKM